VNRKSLANSHPKLLRQPGYIQPISANAISNEAATCNSPGWASEASETLGWHPIYRCAGFSPRRDCTALALSLCPYRARIFTFPDPGGAASGRLPMANICNRFAVRSTGELKRAN